MHPMFFTLFVLMAIVGTALLFVFWLVVTILRGLTRLIAGPGLRPPSLPARMPPVGVRVCGRVSCRALNPPAARFCRRCGQKLDEPQTVSVRRVAMF